MDKSVKRVTVIEGEKENRHANIVYDDHKDVDESAIPPIERAVRHVVNAALITAQVAYDAYVKRAAEGKTDWVFQPHSKGETPEATPGHDPDLSPDPEKGFG